VEGGILKVWTDYPLEGLDEPYSEAPIREVEVQGWDGNKYAKVKFNRHTYTFKVGYLYTRPFRLTFDAEEIPNIDVRQLRVIDIYKE